MERVKYALRKPDDKLEAKFTHVQFGGSKVFCVDGCRLAWYVDDSLTVHQPFMVMPEALDYLKKLLLKTDNPHLFFQRQAVNGGGQWKLQHQVQIDGESSIGFGFDLRYMVDARYRRERNKRSFCKKFALIGSPFRTRWARGKS